MAVQFGFGSSIKSLSLVVDVYSEQLLPRNRQRKVKMQIWELTKQNKETVPTCHTWASRQWKYSVWNNECLQVYWYVMCVFV